MLIDRYSLFIFDWDGTLSSPTFIVRVARLIKRRYSVSRISSHKGSYKIEKMPRFKDEKMSRLYALAYYIYSIFYKPKLKPGAIELFKLLKKRGKKIAVFSDSNRFRLAIEAKKLGIMDYADFVLSADTIKKFKPNPTGLMTIVNQFKFKKSDCIYVGDMAADAFTAKFAGVSFCAVADGVDSEELLEQVGADYIAKSLQSIKKVR